MSLLVADTSAWHRSDHPDVARRWRQELLADRVAATPPMRLEILYSARSAGDLRAIGNELDGLRQVACGERAFARAEEVQRRLGESGGLHHRSVKLVDLLIAAAAEAREATVWHYDEDYERIAAITGQPTEWIAQRGSLGRVASAGPGGSRWERVMSSRHGDDRPRYRPMADWADR